MWNRQGKYVNTNVEEGSSSNGFGTGSLLSQRNLTTCSRRNREETNPLRLTDDDEEEDVQFDSKQCLQVVKL